MEYQTFFSGKRVTLMGLGLLGRGVGDAEFLAPLCKELIVTDQKSAEELAPSVARLQRFSNITYKLGGHSEEDFTSVDMVIKAAGVPLESPYIAAAQKAEVPVYMSTALFAKFAGEKGAVLVGVTGTRGKSTVAHLVQYSLATSGKRAHLGGNIRGVSTLSLLPQVMNTEFVVLELDSWQLQGFGSLRLSPHIALFTNLMPDHLNYYGGETGMEKYFWDKANIFLHQKSGDKLIVGESVLAKVQAANPPVAPVVPPPLPSDWTLRLLGEHNRQNAALAALALKFLGLNDMEVKKGIESCDPVAGRLELLREVRGIKLYNDNNATTPDATLVALQSLKGGLIVIAGGADKGLPLEMLAAALSQTKQVILLPGTGTERLKPLLPSFQEASSMSLALTQAMAMAQSGDSVLLSPAFASFGLFKNEYDRNDQFVAAVTKLA